MQPIDNNNGQDNQNNPKSNPPRVSINIVGSVGVGNTIVGSNNPDNELNSQNNNTSNLPQFQHNTYNAFNQLISVASSNTATGNQSHVARYSYRADGLRHSKTVSSGGSNSATNNSSNNTVTTTHVWDGSFIVLELQSGNGNNTNTPNNNNSNNQTTNVVNRFIRGLNNQLLHSHHHGHYLHNARGDVTQRIDLQRDHQGNVITDQQGNVAIVILHNYFYDGFGNEVSYYQGYNPTNDEETTNTNPWRYAGEYFDFETGNYYLRARYYNPATGRFTQPDPFWNVNNMQEGVKAVLQAGNLFIFVMNNPIRFIDPTGLWGRDVHETLTIEWAIGLGIPPSFANIIGQANYGVDRFTISGGTGPMPWQDPSRHFNRYGLGEEDTRWTHAARYFDAAIATARLASIVYEELSQAARAQGVPSSTTAFNNQLTRAAHVHNGLIERSLIYLGMGLHSLQDIFAHGNQGARNFGISGHNLDFLPHWMGGRLDNVNFIWDPSSNMTRVVPGNGSQARLDQARLATEIVINRFLIEIGGVEVLSRR